MFAINKEVGYELIQQGQHRDGRSRPGDRSPVVRGFAVSVNGFGETGASIGLTGRSGEGQGLQEPSLMLVCERLRYVASKAWGTKRYMRMKHLEEEGLDDSLMTVS